MIRKLIIVFIVVGVCLSAGLLYLKNQFPLLTDLLLGESNAPLFALDQSLVTPGMLMLAHFDRAMLAEFDNETELLAQQQLQLSAGTTINALLSGLKTTDQEASSWSFAAYLTQDSTLSTMVVMRGVLNSSALLEHLRANYPFSSRMVGELTVYDFEAVSEAVCGEKSTWSIYFAPDYIVASDTVLMDRMLPMLAGGVHGGGSLQDWSAFSRGKLASVWLNRPVRLKGDIEVRDPLLKRLLELANDYIGEFPSVYLGVGVDVWSQQGLFAVQGKSRNDAFASFAVAKWQSYMAQKSDQLRVKQPLLYELLQPMALVNEADTVHGKVIFPKEKGAELVEVLVDVVGAALTNTGEGSLDVPAALVTKVNAEQLELAPRRYFAGLTHENLQGFDVATMGAVDGVSGPLGLRFERARLSKEPGQMLLTFSVQGDIPNIGDQLARGQFSLKDFLDDKGGSVVARKRCHTSPDVDVADVPLSSHFMAMQTVALKTGVRIEDVSRLTAKVELSLPSEVKRQRVMLPKHFPQQININSHTTLTLLEQQGSYLGYAVSGRVTDVLEVRALNKDNVILKRKDHFLQNHRNKAGGIERSEGYSTYMGEITALELVIGEGQLIKVYEFDINLPQELSSAGRGFLAKEPVLYLQDGGLAKKSQKLDCGKGQVVAGLFCMRLLDVAVGEAQNQPRYLVRLLSPDSAYVREAITRFTLKLNKLTDDGSAVTYWPIFRDDVVGGGLLVDIMLPDQAEAIKALSGNLVVREATGSEVATLSRLHLGETLAKGQFQAKLIEFDRQGNYTLSVEKGMNRLLMLVARDHLWRPLETKVVEIGSDFVKFNAEGASKLDVYIAVEQKEQAHEFLLDL